jgi:hypothetical protein
LELACASRARGRTTKLGADVWAVLCTRSRWIPSVKVLWDVCRAVHLSWSGRLGERRACRGCLGEVRRSRMAGPIVQLRLSLQAAMAGGRESAEVGGGRRRAQRLDSSLRRRGRGVDDVRRGTRGGRAAGSVNGGEDVVQTRPGRDGCDAASPSQIIRWRLHPSPSNHSGAAVVCMGSERGRS